MIFAIDFDGTICEHKYPEIGKPFLDRINILKELKSSGHRLILWTCRRVDDERQVLKEAVEWCKSHGLEFDAVNEDLPSIKDSHFGKNKSLKIYADFYIDDRNLTIDWFEKMSLTTWKGKNE